MLVAPLKQAVTPLVNSTVSTIYHHVRIVNVVFCAVMLLTRKPPGSLEHWRRKETQTRRSSVRSSNASVSPDERGAPSRAR